MLSSPLVVCVVCSPVIQQSPKHLLQTLEEKEAQLFCRHGDSSYPYMYWYQQKSNGGSLELIGMLNYGTASQEDKFKPRFTITGHAKEDAFLLISTYLLRTVQCISVQQVNTAIQFPITANKKLFMLHLFDKKTKQQHTHQVSCTVYSCHNWQ